jgi:cysteine synthase A
MPLLPERQEIFDRLEKQIGKTELVEIKNSPIDIPNGNRIFAKLEYQNPTGSHYDRYWVRLFRTREDTEHNNDYSGSVKNRKNIYHGQSFPILETSTGNSGASFAWVCRELGYPCEVLIPADMPNARLEQIKYYGARVHTTPKGKYVRGLIERFRQQLEYDKGNYVYTNHATDEKDGVSAIEELGNEIGEYFKENKLSVDYFVSALGNGLTTRFVGKALLKHFNSIKIIGVEPFESPTVYSMWNPQKLKEKYGTIDFNSNHELIGTGPGELEFAFPNMQKVVAEKMLHDIILEKRDEWIIRDEQLNAIPNLSVGHTSAACFDAAIKMAKNIHNKNIVVIFYDSQWKYTDSLPKDQRR